MELQLFWEVMLLEQGVCAGENQFELDNGLTGCGTNVNSEPPHN